MMEVESIQDAVATSDVYLPVELLMLIIDYVGAGYNDRRQPTLHSCSLVSKQWYAVSISHLYEAPVLENRNFDKFARTMSSIATATAYRKMRSNSEPRLCQTSVAEMVKHLNMGRLAYESTRSTTARILSRTKASLESFVSPAASFASNSLAAISKCDKLQLLDMSADAYSMELNSILNAVGHLSNLKTLRLPRDALKPSIHTKPRASWPPNLHHLQINDYIGHRPVDWARLAESWPQSLKVLKIHDCLGFNSLFALYHTGVVCRQIRNLDVSISRFKDRFPIRHMVRTFPGAVTLSFPALTASNTQVHTFEPVGGIEEAIPEEIVLEETESALENLVFTLATGELSPGVLHIALLKKYVKMFPRLRRLEIPGNCLASEDELESEDFLEMLDMLEERATPESSDTSGVFVV